MQESLFNKTFLERDSNTAFFLCDLRNFENAYFEEHLRTVTSESLTYY